MIAYVSSAEAKTQGKSTKEQVHVRKEKEAEYQYYSDKPIREKKKEEAYAGRIGDRKSTRLNSSHSGESRMPSSA